PMARTIYRIFFSSRRRHTRSKRDWSSDVCSSDLPMCTRCERTTKYQAWRCFSLDLVIRAHTFICPTGSRPIAWSTRERMIMTRRSEERRVGKEWRPGGAGEDWNDRQIKQERDELV